MAAVVVALLGATAVSACSSRPSSLHTPTVVSTVLAARVTPTPTPVRRGVTDAPVFPLQPPPASARVARPTATRDAPAGRPAPPGRPDAHEPESTVVPQSPPSSGPDVSVEIMKIFGGRPGDEASVTALTQPDAICTLTFDAPGAPDAAAAGRLRLGVQVAGPKGIVSWVWTIGSETQAGLGRVTVTCGSVSADAPIRIRKERGP